MVYVVNGLHGLPHVTVVGGLMGLPAYPRHVRQENDGRGRQQTSLMWPKPTEAPHERSNQRSTAEQYPGVVAYGPEETQPLLRQLVRPVDCRSRQHQTRPFSVLCVKHSHATQASPLALTHRSKQE